MIDHPTVLVLGAGASNHLGYPLGQGLIDEILNTPTEIDDPNSPNPRLEYAHIEDDIKALKESLAMYPGGSIDAFLSLHPKLMSAGKYLIAKVLKRYEKVSKISNQHDPGWYRGLFNEIYNPETGFDPNIKLITFNYDRSLEAYMLQTLVKGYRLSPAEAWRRLDEIRIEHVHGILGDLRTSPYSQEMAYDKLVQIAQGIKIISEVEAQGNDSFIRAKQYIAEAECLYFLGFGFHEDNIRRLGFESPDLVKSKTIRATVKNVEKVAKHDLFRRLRQCGLEQAVHGNESDCNSFFKEIVCLSSGEAI